MTYKINGTTITQPSAAGWLPRRQVAVDGNNRAVYSPVRSFEMNWDALQWSEYKQIWDLWNGISSTGTVTVDLPTKVASDYAFTTYTGCIIDEPEGREFFQEHVTGVRLLVRNIVTT